MNIFLLNLLYGFLLSLDANDLTVVEIPPVRRREEGKEEMKDKSVVEKSFICLFFGADFVKLGHPVYWCAGTLKL